MKKRLLMTIATATAFSCLITSLIVTSPSSVLLAKEKTTQASAHKTSTTGSTEQAEKPDEETATTTTTTQSSSEEETVASSEPSDEVTSSSSNEENPEESTNEEETSSDEGEESSETSDSETTETEESSESSDTVEPPAESEDVGVANSEEVEENYNFSVSRNSTTQEFIDLIKNDAQQVAWDYDLYASVMIAQAILETGSGNSALSSPPNYNLFGIKGAYEGASVSFPTQEDDGSGNLYTIQAAFRKYPSVKESLEDYARLLHTNFYKGAWKSNAATYKDATKFLTGKYATDTSYNKKLNALIETYKLTDYDVAVGEAPLSTLSKKSESQKIKEEVLQKVSEASGRTEEAKEAKVSIVNFLNDLSNVQPEYSYDAALNGKAALERPINEILASEEIK
ncbi:flagellum-specific peptidoglycan hydrolase FlgJ [Enterococcus sp. PF1-24]|uniref:glucosaminidase domain-containing protein n=1 Tax=unclassified Enterococcus TaxID=2608891 RepID=UPI002475A2F3|nr:MULTISPECIES: glucosaminidase domain-containing protein [unclassified Enterococcus]MDH6365218.1 flagellum-specific peptidoglycan hydrolase FlgJ [Enterococcus sp. PFB1-1]MDH6402319.1 flagellum-specific peptidoglycan hydrolase FlgJ [Enterococcus sp. PF1-24]